MSVAIERDHARVNAQLEAQWRLPDLHARTLAHWQRKLAIIVPYRDRAEHLQALVAHLHNYFRHDKLDRAIPWTLHVVEQADARPFNRGALINAGFELAAADADYVCMHDVDMLPIWADYAWPDCPARVCLYGLPNPQQKHLCIGGVTAVSVADFQALNGFSNGYWGWGYEDYDFRLRILAADLGIEARDGLFTALPHVRNGVTTAGSESEAGRRNRLRIEKLHADGFTDWPQDGLNSLKFSLIDSTPLKVGGAGSGNVFQHRVITND